MLVGAVMGFWAVQRFGGPARSRWPSPSPSPPSPARAIGAHPRVPRDHAAREPDRLRSRADDLRRAAGLSSYLGNDLGLADAPARHQFDPLDLPRAARTLPVVGPILFGQTCARLRARGLCVVARRALPRPHPAGAERARGRRVAGRGRRDGDQRLALPVRCTRSPAARSRASAARASASRSRRSGSTGSPPAPAGSRSRSSSSPSGGPTSASSAPTSSARSQALPFTLQARGRRRSRRSSSRRCRT